MRRLVFVLPVLVVLALAGFFARALWSGQDPSVLPSAMIDQPMPAFDLPGLSAEALNGQVAVVNFFASWCAPCRVEHPLLMRLSAQEKVPLFGIAYKDDPAASARFLAQLGDPYRRIGADRDGRTAIDFGVYGVPETYVIDSQGHIRKRFVGPLTPEAVDGELLPLLRRLNAGS